MPSNSLASRSQRVYNTFTLYAYHMMESKSI